jgi:hypothetical protein
VAAGKEAAAAQQASEGVLGQLRAAQYELVTLKAASAQAAEELVAVARQEAAEEVGALRQELAGMRESLAESERACEELASQLHMAEDQVCGWGVKQPGTDQVKLLRDIDGCVGAT